MCRKRGMVRTRLHLAGRCPGPHHRGHHLVAFTGDLFFPREDIKSDADRIPNPRFVGTGTVWGHFTVFNLREQDTAAIDAIYGRVLST